jgi:hypothetical protein
MTSRQLLLLISLVLAPASSQSQSQSSAPAAALDAGSVINNVYRNRTLALSCKIPPGWILRTDELNALEVHKEEKMGDKEKTDDKKTAEDPETGKPAPAASSAGARVLLAAFSRPPEARAEDVNSSILIAAESVSSYPGLKDAIQYFGPLTEVAQAQGFTPDEDPYDISIDTKTLARADFHKDVGTRVMRQSTLALLSHGYAVSITVIAGTEDEVEDLINDLTFTPSKR